MPLTLGVMQPYFLPYIGYFQLVDAVDEFIIYDDVQMIKGGWINRNAIPLGGVDWTFTVPLRRHSSQLPISRVEVGSGYEAWKARFLETVKQTYGKRPAYPEVMARCVLPCLGSGPSIADIASCGVVLVARYLGTTTAILRNSRLPALEGKGQDKLIALCRSRSATRYVNSAGGRSLYDRGAFRQNGIEIDFLECGCEERPSILHLLMTRPKAELASMMGNFNLS